MLEIKKHPLYQEDLQYVLGIDGINQLCHKKFLITGATGLIGVYMIDALMAYNQRGADIEVYAVGRSAKGAALRLGEYFGNDHFQFIEQDVREELPAEAAVDFVIPLASYTHPLAYSQYPVETIEINIKGAENALKHALKCDATVLYPSSVEVYGNAHGDDVFTEDYTGRLNLSNARACYTESKRLSEALCQSYIAERELTVKIVRLSRVFGPTMLMSDSKASSQFINKALNGENIVLKSKGEQLFSYTYVADAVAAMLYVLIHGESGVPYNISNPACNVKLIDFAKACATAAGTEVVFDLPTETEKKGFSIAQLAVLDSNRLNILGFVSKYSFEDAIDRTMRILTKSGMQ